MKCFGFASKELSLLKAGKLSHAANYAIEMPVLYYRFYISFNILVCITVSTNYLHVAVLIGRENLTKEETKNY